MKNLITLVLGLIFSFSIFSQDAKEETKIESLIRRRCQVGVYKNQSSMDKYYFNKDGESEKDTIEITKRSIDKYKKYLENLNLVYQFRCVNGPEIEMNDLLYIIDSMPNLKTLRIKQAKDWNKITPEIQRLKFLDYLEINLYHDGFIIDNLFTNIKTLEYLTIQSYVNLNSIFIDNSFYDGLVNLTNLRKLEISNVKFDKLSDENLEKLLKITKNQSFRGLTFWNLLSMGSSLQEEYFNKVSRASLLEDKHAPEIKKTIAKLIDEALKKGVTFMVR